MVCGTGAPFAVTLVGDRSRARQRAQLALPLGRYTTARFANRPVLNTLWFALNSHEKTDVTAPAHAPAPLRGPPPPAAGSCGTCHLAARRAAVTGPSGRDRTLGAAAAHV